MTTSQFPGGICRTRDLMALGWRQTDIRRAVRRDALHRLRPGWYASPTADDSAARAVTAGGSLACASALAYHGAWDLTGGVLHVRVDHNRTEPLPAGMHRCRPPAIDGDGAPARAVDDLETALRTAWRCLGDEDFVVVCDSLVDRRVMGLDAIARQLAPFPGVDEVLARCDAAESGTESLVRLRLRRRGIRLRTQVWVTPRDRVDLLVGDRLVIEADSWAHHTGVERYTADRARDLRLRALGFIVVRLTHHQVVVDWAATEQSLLAMLRRGDHRWRSHQARATV